MAISIFSILAILIFGASIYLAYKKEIWKFELILIAGLLVVWGILIWLKSFLVDRLPPLEQLGLVQALLLQVMDKLFFNIVAPVTALLVAVFKKAK